MARLPQGFAGCLIHRSTKIDKLPQHSTLEAVLGSKADLDTIKLHSLPFALLT